MSASLDSADSGGGMAIRVTNVSKVYPKYARPIDRLGELLWPARRRAEHFWALRDVTLEVPCGHTVGLVGRNGSGKSTLLQLVAGTLTPSSGEVGVHGRVAALLELGSGFNPDFTGRENVRFQATLMGLTGDPLEACIEESARFAEIGDFIDRPVRTYSSGMFVRLAFAVAISVRPDVLIVDEALSVGDEAFQRRCFGRIREIQDHGGTILFVSHAASAVVELCDWAVLLDRGEILSAGSPKQVVARYHKLLFTPTEQQERQRAAILAEANSGAPSHRPGGPSSPGSSFDSELGDRFDPGLMPAEALGYVPRGAEIVEPRLLTLSGTQVNVVTRRREYRYVYRVRFTARAFKVRFGMLIKTVTGFEIGGAVSHPASGGFEVVDAGQIAEVAFRFKALLRPGVYFLNAGVVGVEDGEEVYLHRFVDVAAFRVQPEVDEIATGVVDFLAEPEVQLGSETLATLTNGSV